MDLNFTEAERAFQQEVRDFLAASLTPELKRGQALTASVFAEPDIGTPWHRALAAKGWIAPAWPAEYGGTGWSPAQRWIFATECARAGAPIWTNMGLQMVGPVIMHYGTQAQKDYYLPRILSGEDYWCQGYSEPGSGSDLASLKTRAVRDGDDYVINGTKIWTTHAHHATKMFALVRTADTGRKQEGITFILIDMTTPGISIRPIMTIGGDHEVNQVFFDDVRVPVANRIGEEGKGWTVGKYLLEFERGGAVTAGQLRASLERVVEVARNDGRLDDFALRAAEIDIEIDALETTELRVMSALASGQNPGAISSLLKLRHSELRQSVTRLGADVLGQDALVVEPRRPLYHLNEPALLPESELPFVPEYLNSRAYSIFGGSSEVQHEIIAKQMVGL